MSDLDTAFVVWLLGSLVAGALAATLAERYANKEDTENE